MRNQNGDPSIDAARKREAQRANASPRRFVVRGLLPALNVFLALSYGSEGRADISAAWALLAVVWSLTPFVRTDGYWLVADALGSQGPDVNIVLLPDDLGHVGRHAGFVRINR